MAEKLGTVPLKCLPLQETPHELQVQSVPYHVDGAKTLSSTFGKPPSTPGSKGAENQKEISKRVKCSIFYQLVPLDNKIARRAVLPKE